MPGEGRYVEISSVSDCGTFQARGLQMRYRPAAAVGRAIHIHSTARRWRWDARWRLFWRTGSSAMARWRSRPCCALLWAKMRWASHHSVQVMVTICGEFRRPQR